METRTSFDGIVHSEKFHELADPWKHTEGLVSEPAQEWQDSTS